MVFGLRVEPQTQLQNPSTFGGGDLLGLKPKVTSLSTRKESSLNLKKGPSEHLVLALLHKCADIGGPGWQLSRRHCPEGMTKKDVLWERSREGGEEERSPAEGMQNCLVAVVTTGLHLRAGLGRLWQAHFKGKASAESRRRTHGFQG